MSSTQTTTLGTPSTTVRTLPLGLGTVAAAVAFNALGVFGDGTDGGEHSAGEFWFVNAIIVVSAAIVFGLVVPRYTGRATGLALGLSIAGLVFVPVAFWSGLPAVLAIGGVMLGTAGRDRGRGRAANVAVVIGILALIGYVAVYVLDWMATNNIAGM